MRFPFQRQPESTWESDKYIWLENAGAEHIILHLPSGELRLDMGRKLRFRPDVLQQPQVKTLVDEGKLVVRE